MSIELRIKAASLTAEARIIRKYEQRLKRMRAQRIHAVPYRDGNGELRIDTVTLPGTNPEGYTRWGNAKLVAIQAHRRGPVRSTARLTCLALAFLNGTPYKRAEQPKDGNALAEGQWNAIHRMVTLYGRVTKADGADPKQRIPLTPQELAQKFEEWKQADSV